jgi:hypothetical protein
LTEAIDDLRTAPGGADAEPGLLGHAAGVAAAIAARPGEITSLHHVAERFAAAELWYAIAAIGGAVEAVLGDAAAAIAARRADATILDARNTALAGRARAIATSRTDATIGRARHTGLVGAALEVTTRRTEIAVQRTGRACLTVGASAVTTTFGGSSSRAARAVPVSSDFEPGASAAPEEQEGGREET